MSIYCDGCGCMQCQCEDQESVTRLIERDPQTKDIALLSQLRDELDEANFHPVGNTWRYLNELVDRPGMVVGTLAAWTLCLGGTPRDGGVPLSDDYHTLVEQHDIDALARERLGLTEAEWFGLQCSTAWAVQHAIDRLLGRDTFSGCRICRANGCNQIAMIGGYCLRCHEEIEALCQYQLSRSERSSLVWAAGMAVAILFTLFAVGMLLGGAS